MKALFVSDYRDQPERRESFFTLAQTVFGIQFRPWYEHGCWTECYIPYSLQVDDTIVANVSVNKMSLHLEGEDVSGIQIGTVMTHPQYRGKGLADQLMHLVMEMYRDQVEVIYLFAHEKVAQFYPKYGFQQITESAFWYEPPLSLREFPEWAHYRPVRLADIRQEEPLERIIRQRKPVSWRQGVKEDMHIVSFYLLGGMDELLYLDEENGVLFLMEYREGFVHLYDVFFLEEERARTAVRALSKRCGNGIRFYFQPDRFHLPITEKSPDSTDLFFVTKSLSGLQAPVFLPYTSRA